MRGTPHISHGLPPDAEQTAVPGGGGRGGLSPGAVGGRGLSPRVKSLGQLLSRWGVEKRFLYKEMWDCDELSKKVEVSLQH